MKVLAETVLVHLLKKKELENYNIEIIDTPEGVPCIIIMQLNQHYGPAYRIDKFTDLKAEYIADYICRDYLKNKTAYALNLENWDSVKHMILPIFVKSKTPNVYGYTIQNTDIHVEYAIIFKDGNKCGTIRIPNKIFNIWNIDFETLKEQVKANIENQIYNIFSMGNFLGIKRDFSDDPIKILTNEKEIYSACGVFSSTFKNYVKSKNHYAGIQLLDGDAAMVIITDDLEDLVHLQNMSQGLEEENNISKEILIYDAINDCYYNSDKQKIDLFEKE